MTNHEYDYKEKKIPNVGIYYDKECPIGNKNLLYTIFAINYILLIFSIFVSYQGRLSKLINFFFSLYNKE